jgi:polysaccharide transporter, PST family
MNGLVPNVGKIDVTSPGAPLKNIFWLAGERVARAGLTATVLGLVARHLEPGGFGRLNFAIAIVAIATALANLGLEGLVVSEIIRRPGREGAVLGTAFRMRIAAGAFTGILLFAAIGFTPATRHDIAPIAIISLGLLLQPAEVVDLWFQRHLQSRRTVAVRLAAVAAGGFLKLGLVLANAGVVAFAWAQAAESGFFAVGLLFAYLRSPARPDRWTWDPEIARVFWRRGAPLAVAGVVVALSLRFDQILVTEFLGARVAGIYFAAARLTEVALFAGTATTLSLFPILAASHGKTREVFRASMQSTFDVLSLLGWVVAGGFTLLGPWAIRIIYGPTYAEAGPILIWQGWACIFALSAGARWQFILLEAPTSVNLVAALLGIATQLSVAVWTVPRLGAVGIAVAWFAGSVMSGFATSFLIGSLRPCAGAQTRGLLIPFAPSRWPAMIRLFLV